MIDELDSQEEGLQGNTLYLVCFVLGLVLSLLAVFSGLGGLHIGHLHIGHANAHTHVHANAGNQVSALNGFTLPAFLCWFGGAGCGRAMTDSKRKANSKVVELILGK